MLVRARVALTERHAPSHGNMGLCYAKLGNKAKALAELDRALEIDPQYEPAMANRVVVERMEEGCPMSFASFQSIEYSKERLGRGKFPPMITEKWLVFTSIFHSASGNAGTVILIPCP